jgi:hypothetical protein
LFISNPVVHFAVFISKNFIPCSINRSLLSQNPGFGWVVYINIGPCFSQPDLGYLPVVESSFDLWLEPAVRSGLTKNGGCASAPDVSSREQSRLASRQHPLAALGVQLSPIRAPPLFAGAAMSSVGPGGRGLELSGAIYWRLLRWRIKMVLAALIE